VSHVALLDVNVLVALFDPDHIHHDLAHDWFAEQRGAGWATCPLTENGLVRVLTSPRFRTPGPAMSDVTERLRRLRLTGRHHFWADDISLTDTSVFRPAAIRGHKQVTDIYLAGLAQVKGGQLATLDRRIPVGAIVKAKPGLLQVIEPAAS
jgi:toxin-antitoxin system PIN domain toxin